MIDTAAIIAATDLIALIAETVRLKKQGAQSYGLCPFHSDKSPTLRVDPKKQLWFCPSCQIGGDAISWLRHRDAIPFRTAANDLAKRAGLADGPRVPQDAPRLAPVPDDARYPHPYWEPRVAWGNQHAMEHGRPVLILHARPGAVTLAGWQATHLNHNVIWWPGPTDGWIASAQPGPERMDLTPIARAEIAIPPTRDPHVASRGRELVKLIWRWRGYAIMGDSRRAGLV